MLKGSTKMSECSYIITPKKLYTLELRHKEENNNVDAYIKVQSGPKFINPYRHGPYYGLVQSLYLLGANKYHNETIVKNKMQEVLIKIVNKGGINQWEMFINKLGRNNSFTIKDIRGRIQASSRMLQRLKGKTPYGNSLRQFCSCIDIQACRIGFWDYCLNTNFPDYDSVAPKFDWK